MTLATLGSPTALFPIPALWHGAGGTASTFQMNGAGKQIFALINGEEGFTLDEVSFYASTVTTGATPAGTVRVYTVDASNGRPNAEISGGGYTAQTFNLSTGTPAAVKVTGLSAVLAADTDYLVVITYNGGDWTVTTSLGDSTLGTNRPYVGTFDGTSTYTMTGGRGGMRMGFGAASSAWRRRPTKRLGAYSNLVASFSADRLDNPDEVGIVFRVDVPCRLWGASFNGRMNSAGGSYQLRAWSSLSSPAQLTGTGRTIDGDLAATTGATGSFWNEDEKFAATADLVPGVDYIISLRSTSDTITMNVRYTQWPSADHCSAAFPTTIRMVTREGDTGAFTVDDDAVPWIVPLVIAYDDAAGGAGVKLRPSLSGHHAI